MRDLAPRPLRARHLLDPVVSRAPRTNSTENRHNGKPRITVDWYTNGQRMVLQGDGPVLISLVCNGQVPVHARRPSGAGRGWTTKLQYETLSMAFCGALTLSKRINLLCDYFVCGGNATDDFWRLCSGPLATSSDRDIDGEAAGSGRIHAPPPPGHTLLGGAGG